MKANIPEWSFCCSVNFCWWFSFSV